MELKAQNNGLYLTLNSFLIICYFFPWLPESPSGVQSRCSSPREVVSYSPGPSSVKYRSHPNHLTVGEPRVRIPKSTLVISICLSRFTKRSSPHRLGSPPAPPGALPGGVRPSSAQGWRGAGANRGTWRPMPGRDPSLSLRLPLCPSAADLYEELCCAARLASSPWARGPTPCGCRPRPGRRRG